MNKAWIESVYDGDTFTVVVAYGNDNYDDSSWEEVRPNLFSEVNPLPLYDNPNIRERIRVRLLGVDAPEMRGDEKEQGKVSAEWVRNELARCEDGSVQIEMTKTDSFGRWLCNVFYVHNGYRASLADAMLTAGMAEVYAKSRSAANTPIQHVPW